MRTTVTLDPDVVRLLEEEKARQRKSFKEVVNDAIRRGLARQVKSSSSKPFRVSPHRTTLRPGIDAGKLDHLSDELEDEEVLRKAARRA
jgi:hypothetical protein